MALTAVPQVVNEDTPIVVDCLDCRGTETRLTECEHYCTDVEFCSHFYDAGAFCSNIIGMPLISVTQLAII